jgi:replicative DNA helicase
VSAGSAYLAKVRAAERGEAPQLPDAPPEDTADAWEAPVPLDGVEVPPLPLDALPAVLRDYTAALAAFAEVPADLPGVLALATVAAAVARKVSVLVRHDYGEPLNLYALVALPPGARKSAVYADATAPLAAHERELVADLGPAIAEAQSQARVREKELAHAETMAAREGSEAMKWGNARRELARLIRETVPPAEPRVMVADVTPEAVTAQLAAQGGRLAVFSPEGDSVALMRRYAKDGTPNLEVYLKAHAGDELRVDRKHAAPVTVERPALTMALTVQPDVLRGMAGDPMMRERGLLARFLYAVPEPVTGRTFDGPAVPAAARDRYADAIAWLCRWSGQADPLALAPEAFAAWQRFAREVEHERELEGCTRGSWTGPGSCPGSWLGWPACCTSRPGPAAERSAPRLTPRPWRRPSCWATTPGRTPWLRSP